MLAERPFSDGISPMNALAQSPLRRFVTDGLHDTIASYTAGTLPLHRFAWELDSRLATLAELTGLPHWRTLNVLRAAQHTIAGLDTVLRAETRAGLTAAEEHTMAAALLTLRTTLAHLDPDDPVDPVDPAAPRPVVVTLATRPTAHHTAGDRRALIA
jgi:hypothetical protein